jgi:hypothetical protein
MLGIILISYVSQKLNVFSVNLTPPWRVGTPTMDISC